MGELKVGEPIKVQLSNKIYQTEPLDSITDVKDYDDRLNLTGNNRYRVEVTYNG